MAEETQTDTKSETIINEAKEFLVQGKRFMAVGDFETAVDCLEQSCKLYDTFYGVGKPSCADAYFEYGLALVALANLEAGTGEGNILKKAGIEEEEEECGDEDEEDDENDDENEEPPVEATNGSASTPASSSAQVDQSSSTRQQLATSSTDVITDIQPTSSTSASDPAPSTSTGAQQDDAALDDEEQEATTMEIAWEVLCLAKRMYMASETMESKLKLAETLQKLGEISIEWDNNDNAVGILTECLEIRTAILPENDRLIASTYYHLGLAHSFKQNTNDANECFKNAMKVINKKIDQLQDHLKLAEENQDVAVKAVYEKELAELRDLLPEISMRIDEEEKAGELATEAIKRSREEVEEEEAQHKKVCSDTSKPTSDISHLVKRK